MIPALIRRFVKNSDNPKDPAVRREYGVFADLLGIICNLVLFVIKLVIGNLIHSYAIRADAWVNFAAALRTILRRYDPTKYLLAFISAFVVFEAGFSYFSRSFTRLMHPVSVQSGLIPVLVLAACIFLRTWLAAVQVRIGRTIVSDPLLREARRRKADNTLTIFATLAVVLDGLLNINTNFLAALLISVVLMIEGLLIAANAVLPNITESPDPELVRNVKERIRRCSGVLGLGSVKTKFYGPGRRMIAARIKVPAGAKQAEIDTLAKEIETAVGEEFDVTLILHADPISTGDEEEAACARLVERELEAIDDRLSFDHFHLVRGKELTNLIFDVFVPFEYDELRIELLVKRIGDRMKEIDPKYECVIWARRLG